MIEGGRHVEKGAEIIDHVLFADTGSEKPTTYLYLELFGRWLEDRGVPLTVVRYQPQRYKNYPPYRTLDENCFTNGTLPSIAFGFSSCSQKWKIAPQNKWTESWKPALDIWEAGGKVTKLIGYDCSPADMRRYAEREGYTDDRYHYRYPLREWGWKRADCEERIRQAGLPVPPKSACWMCTATKPHELHNSGDYPPSLLRRIVLMEARAAPRLRTTEGLWRKAVKGTNGATPKPGSMTQYIREQKLLPTSEIDHIINSAPEALMAWQDWASGVPLEERSDMKEWLAFFDLTSGDQLETAGRRFYQDLDVGHRRADDCVDINNIDGEEQLSLIPSADMFEHGACHAL
ncbi:hypothetical protein [Sphingomonas sp. 3-13AW]|uniref:hypothetical protein n=1 Tax=Sphingomonas sp. 3-13AW TaxID=3050450 RepID=UPI003BB64479